MKNVPYFSHVGNDPLVDSTGCFLVGEAPGTDYIFHSLDAMNNILKVINNDSTGEIEVNIVDDYEDPCT